MNEVSIRSIRAFLQAKVEGAPVLKSGGTTVKPSEGGLGIGGDGGQDDSPTFINPKLDGYLNIGLTEEVLDKFFNLETGELKPEYSSVKELGGGIDNLITGAKYKNKFVFEDAKNPGTFTEVKVMEDGTIKVQKQDMAKDVGKTSMRPSDNVTANNKTDAPRTTYTADQLKESGMTDEIRDKYYEKTADFGPITGGYRLKKGYEMQAFEGGKDPVNGKDYSTRFDFSKIDEKGKKIMGETTSEFVYADGTTGTRKNDGPTREEAVTRKKEQHDAMIAKGYTDEIMDKYFDYVTTTDGVGGYNLKSQYSNVKEFGGGIDNMMTGAKYKSKFVFEDAKNPGTFTEVKVMEDGTIKVQRQSTEKDESKTSIRDPKTIAPKAPMPFSEILKTILAFFIKNK